MLFLRSSRLASSLAPFNGKTKHFPRRLTIVGVPAGIYAWVGMQINVRMRKQYGGWAGGAATFKPLLRMCCASALNVTLHFLVHKRESAVVTLIVDLYM